MIKYQEILTQVTSYIDWLNIYDNATTQSQIDSIMGTFSDHIESLLISNLNKVRKYFENVLDQPVYMSDDYFHLRRFLIYWYAAYKTLMDENKFLSDIDFIDKKLMLQSMGYYLYYLTDDKVNKDILLNLSFLYDKKGTPWSIQKILQLIGLRNFELFEYWLYNINGQLKFVPKKVTDTGLTTSVDNMMLLSKDYNKSIAVTDPHWYYTQAEILALDSTNGPDTLPSLTPYIGILSVNDWVRLCRLVTSLISRIINEQAQNLETNNIYPEGKYYSQWFKKNLSLLEVVLLFNYLYNKHFGVVSTFSRQSLNIFIQHYNGSSVDDETKFIVEFERLRVKRPKTKAEKEQMEKELKLLFLSDDKEIVWTFFDVAVFLNKYYINLKIEADNILSLNKGEDAIIELLEILNHFIQKERGIINFNFLFIIRDFFLTSKDAVIKIINFFKPYQVRIMEFAQYLLIDDCPGNILIPDDSIEEIIKEYTGICKVPINDDFYLLTKDAYKDTYQILCYGYTLSITEKFDDTYIVKDHFSDLIIDNFGVCKVPLVDDKKDIIKEEFIENIYISDDFTIKVIELDDDPEDD